MTLENICAIVADRLALPRDRVARYRHWVDPDAEPFEQAAELILMVMANGSEEWREWYDGEPDHEQRPRTLIAGFLELLAGKLTDDAARLAYRSTITVTPNSVVVHLHCDDGVLEFAHTADGAHAPYRDLGLLTAKTISGRTLLAVAFDMADHLPAPIERRTFKFEVVR